MGKLIIAIDIPESKRKDTFPVSIWDGDNIKYIAESQMNKIQLGEIVSFDSIFLTTDREDDSFTEAEFRGWEPTEKIIKQTTFEETKPGSGVFKERREL